MSRSIAAKFAVRDEASPAIREIAERVRALGLHVTSPTPEETDPMPARNPYDRRVRHDGEEVDLGRPMMAGYGSMETPRVLALEDLEAMVFSARQRGEVAAGERLNAQHAERMTAACRQAWDEGFEDGYNAGIAEHRQAYDNAFGELVHGLHTRAVAIVDARERKTKAEREATTVAALLEFALEVAKATDGMIEQHNAGLKTRRQRDREMPF